MRIRLVLGLRLVLAHLAGLAALGVYGALGSGEAFLREAGFFALIAGAFSLPVFVPVLVVAVALARWVEANLLVFVLAGPVLVCLGWVAVAGGDFLPGIALATGAASLVFAALAMLDWPARRLSSVERV